jgi:hypothetical protein
MRAAARRGLGSLEVGGSGAPMAISSQCDAYEMQTQNARLSAHRAPPDALDQRYL